jgi:hypothetical protein
VSEAEPGIFALDPTYLLLTTTNMLVPTTKTIILITGANSGLGEFLQYNLVISSRTIKNNV